MSIRHRLAKAEGSLADTLLWSEAEKLALELGQRPEELYREAHELIDRYWFLAKSLPSGRLDIKPVLHAIAKDEGLDYEELRAEVKNILRGQKTRAGLSR